MADHTVSVRILLEMLQEYDKQHGRYPESELEGLAIWDYLNARLGLMYLPPEARAAWVLASRPMAGL